MAEPLELLHDQQSRAFERYTYFLLATAAAAIAFGVQRTEDASLQWSQLPLGFAVITWAISFWCGIERLNAVETVRSANMEIIKLALRHQRLPELESQMQAANRRAHRFWEAQFIFIATGAILFVIWHIVEMYLRRSAG